MQSAIADEDALSANSRGNSMRNSAIALGALCAALSSATAFAGTEEDKAAIIKLEHELADIQSADQAAKFYAPGDDTELFDGFAPGIYRGVKAIEKDFAEQLANEKSVKIDFRELTAGADGNLGFAYSVQHAAVEMKDGSKTDVVFRETDILRKIGGRWLIAHQHISYPADAKTGKVVLDSSEK